MIHEVSGDILLTKAQAIAHGIAPNDHFDRGLALALREKWPMMATDFRHHANQSHPEPGEMWVWGGFNVRVFNLMTQEGEHTHGSKPGKASIVNVNHCLKHLQHELEKGEISSIAISRLATGVGGLDWKQVLPLIQSHLGGLKIPVFVYSHYEPGVQAKETGI
jgi:O-acetyl-ADP-ribose deacetylase (regulator of RNase III)